MITLRNHALRSHMTQFPVALSVLDMIMLWHHRHWFPKFTVGFRSIRKELESNVYSFFLLDCIVVEFSSNQYYQTSYLGVISQSEILTIIINSTTRILILKLLFYIKLTQQEMLWEHRLLVIVFTPFLIHPKICFWAPHLLLIRWECNVALWQQILYSLFILYSWYKRDSLLWWGKPQVLE